MSPGSEVVKSGEPDGRLVGVGLATYCEQAAHGTSVYYGWGIPMVPGHEQPQHASPPTAAWSCGSASTRTGKDLKRRGPSGP